jgi:hypothetical protein
MGLFGGRSRARNFSGTQRPTITHKATWGSAWAVFFINSEGVSWNQSRRDFNAIDSLFLEAAMAQLQQAYHLSISYPEAENRIMDWMRGTQEILKEQNPDTPDIPDDAVPAFEWSPLLPGYK